MERLHRRVGQATAQARVGSDMRHRRRRAAKPMVHRARRKRLVRRARPEQEVTMAQIIGIASLGALIALATVAWKSVPPRPDLIAGANPVSLSVSDLGLKVNAKALPQQRIEDRTLVFVGP
jgi:hypothetical protein